MAAPAPAKSEARIKAEEVVAKNKSPFVRLHWTDNAALTRCRVVPAERIFTTLSEKGTPVFGGCMALPMMFDSVAPGIGDAGVSGGVVMKPDLSTMKPMNWYPNHCHVMGSLYTSDGKPWSQDPRGFLKRQLDIFKEKYGMEIVAGVEHEFIVYSSIDDNGVVKPINECNYSESYGLAGEMGPIMDEIVTAMMDAGIPLNQYHTECADGQYEITTAPMEAMELADANVFIHDAVRAIVKKHGYEATFSPKAFADQAGSASHIHFSFRDIKTGENTYPDWNEPTGISKHGQAFMAGILEHLTTLTAITLPSAASQFRVVDSAWAGVYTAWGVENKETPLRVTNDTQGRVNNLEIKCIDGTSNVYLAMGAILAAGLDGMERSLALGPNVQCDPADLSPEERAKLKISKIPNTFKSSLASFAANPLWKKAMGEDMQRVFLLNKTYEMDFFADKSDAEIRKWHLKRY